MYRVYKIRVSDGPLYDYFSDICKKSKDLYNVCNFMIRQNMTGLHKSPEERQPTEKETIERTISGITELNKRRKDTYNKKVQKIFDDEGIKDKEKAISELRLIQSSYPTEDNWFLGYNILEGILKVEENPEYKSLPAQVNQWIIKSCVNNWLSYFEALKEYKKSPDKFLGKPKIIKYLQKDGEYKTIFTNQVCHIKENQNNKKYLRFPKTNHKLWLGKIDTDNFMQAEIIPKHGIYEVCLVFKTIEQEKDNKTKVIPE